MTGDPLKRRRIYHRVWTLLGVGGLKESSKGGSHCLSGCGTFVVVAVCVHARVKESAIERRWREETRGDEMALDVRRCQYMITYF